MTSAVPRTGPFVVDARIHFGVRRGLWLSLTAKRASESHSVDLHPQKCREKAVDVNSALMEGHGVPDMLPEGAARGRTCDVHVR